MAESGEFLDTSSQDNTTEKGMHLCFSRKQPTPHGKCFFFSPATGDYSCNEEKRNGRNYSDSFQPCRKIWQIQNVTYNNLVLIMVVTYME